MHVALGNSRSVSSHPYGFCLALAIALVLFAACFALSGCAQSDGERPFESASSDTAASATESGFTLNDVPPYKGNPSVEINGNRPFFTAEDLRRGSFETYSVLDALGRCGSAYALIGRETMPNEQRGSIGIIKPSGWQVAKYDWVDGNYLFNRCHLIGFALAGENDNPLNLITGTRSMNVQGMLPYEERVASYVDETSNHVLYRVSPFFDGDNLVASGVLMEGESVEDGGAGVRFCAWCYNVEPGVYIDYATGDNHADSSVQASSESDDALAGESDPRETAASGIIQNDPVARLYVLNTNTKRFHYPECSSVAAMKDKNKREHEGTRDEIAAMGYKPCGVCNP